MKLPLIAIALCALAPLHSHAQTLVNGNFEAAPLLGTDAPAQTAVPAGQSKLISVNPADPRYPDAISGIPNWINSLSDFGSGPYSRDAGLRRDFIGDPGDLQYAFINNWDTRLSQISSLNVMGGHTYQAQIEVGFSELDQAGRFQLWAGAPIVGNEDNFPSSAVLLADLAVNSNTYTLGQWHPLSLTYTAPTSGDALGQALTVSFMTTSGSHGPTFWDNAALSVTVVPEPQAYLMMLLGLGVLAGVAKKRQSASQA